MAALTIIVFVNLLLFINEIKYFIVNIVKLHGRRSMTRQYSRVSYSAILAARVCAQPAF